MVMSQAAIDALMAQNAAGSDESGEEEDQLDQVITAEGGSPAADGDEGQGDGTVGALTDEERALVEAMATEEDDEDSAEPTPEETLAEDASADEDSKPTLRKWSASSTSTTDQLTDRVQDLEDKIGIIEASSAGSPAADSGDTAEIKHSLEQLTTTIQSLWNAVQQLTEQSQASLGFAAK